MVTKETISAFDEFLHTREKLLEATIAGGAALQLLGVVSRLTQDVDMVQPDLTIEIRLLAMEFAQERQDLKLDVSWLNDAASIFLKNLEPGWDTRTETVFDGKALKLKSLGRQDLLVSKIGSYLSRGNIDLEDCKALGPDEKALDSAISWVLSKQAKEDQEAAKERLEKLREEVTKEKENDYEPER